MSKLSDELESIVDSHGLAATLDILASIAAEKAEHLRANWQDENAAREWSKAARKIDATAAAILTKCALP